MLPPYVTGATSTSTSCLNSLVVKTKAGLVPFCSWPTAGSSGTFTTSPRSKTGITTPLDRPASRHPTSPCLQVEAPLDRTARADRPRCTCAWAGTQQQCCSRIYEALFPSRHPFSIVEQDCTVWPTLQSVKPSSRRELKRAPCL